MLDMQCWNEGYKGIPIIGRRYAPVEKNRKPPNLPKIQRVLGCAAFKKTAVWVFDLDPNVGRAPNL